MPAASWLTLAPLSSYQHKIIVIDSVIAVQGTRTSAKRLGGSADGSVLGGGRIWRSQRHPTVVHRAFQQRGSEANSETPLFKATLAGRLRALYWLIQTQVTPMPA